MERQIKLSLRMPNNKYQDFTQDFVPFSKRQDYIRKEADLEKKFKGEVPESEYIKLQTEFVANLFEDERVTPELINSGLDTLDRNKIFEIIRYRVLGYNKEEEDKLKKAQMNEILAGLTSTNSNEDLSGK